MRKILSSFSLALGNIRSNIFHTILSVLGIVIGVGALVSILSLIDGMERYARDQVSSTTSLNAIVVRTEFFTTRNNVRIRKDSAATISFEAFKDLHKALSKNITRYFRVSGTAMVYVDEVAAVVAVNTFATDTTLVPGLKFRSGNAFTTTDVAMKRPVAIVNNSFLNVTKLDSSAAIGREVSLGNKKLTITGVVADKGADAPQIYFPITLIDDTDFAGTPADVAFEVEHTEDIPALRTEIKAWLERRYGKAADDFQIITNEFRVEQLAKGFLLFRIIMGLIVGISVIVGGIGVMNVLLISVTERTSEIGIRKALGANRRDIAFLFLTESVAVSAFGSMLGVLFGIGFTMIAIPIVKALTKVPFQADYTFNTIAITALVALLVGIIFGTYPAIRASRLNPVDAIRHE
ncbi:MAG TPA: ABC transporter permease [Cyclobacteriaceae bacterium]|nr:ABC transporter permease [Cyclobacteriaceae bacterium]